MVPGRHYRVGMASQDARPSAPTRTARTRARLVAAAQEVLGEQGAAASVHVIAERAGVGVGTLYRHFGGKEALFREAVQRALLDFESWMRQFTSPIDDPAWRFGTSSRMVCRMPLTHPVNARVLIQPLAVEMMSDGPYPQAAWNDMQSGIDAGRFAPPDAHMALAFLWAMTRQIIALGAVGTAPPTTQFIDDAVQQGLEMLGMDRAEASRIAHAPFPPGYPAAGT